MMNVFEVVIPTKLNKSDFEKTQTFKCINSICKTSMAEDRNICLQKTYYENKTGLSELYGNHLKQTDADYVLFMHDDVEVHDHFIFKKLLKAHETYDIVGLAGATSQNYNTTKPLAWHICKDNNSDGRGIVSHFIPKGVTSHNADHFNSTYFGPTPSPVVVIDGLFMSFKTSSAKNLELFDKDFTFHFYDMATCANAKMKNLNIGVWPIFVIHYGLGEFRGDHVWEDHQNKFRNKFNNYKIKV